MSLTPKYLQLTNKASDPPILVSPTFATTHDLWVTFDIQIPQSTIDYSWNVAFTPDILVLQKAAGGDSQHPYSIQAVSSTTAQNQEDGPLGNFGPTVVADASHTIEVHIQDSTAGNLTRWHLDGTSYLAGATGDGSGGYNALKLGLFADTTDDDPTCIILIDNIKVGTTRGGSDLFADDFETGDLSAWASVSGSAQATVFTGGGGPSIYWGARIDGQFYVDNASGNWTAPTDNQDAPWSAAITGDSYDLFRAHAGKDPTCLHWGGPGNTLPTSYDTTASADVRAVDAFSLYSVAASTAEMHDLANNSNAHSVLTKVDDWATEVAADGNPILARFCWEMNGNWGYPWQTGAGVTAAQYVAAFRIWSNRVRAIASNVSIVWCPNIMGGTVPDPTAWDPGMAYYDWTGTDGYNYGAYRTPASIFDATLNVLRSRAPGYPIAICETGCEAPTSSPGKAAWITELLGTYVPANPDIKLVCWFNESGNPVWPHIEVGDTSSDFLGAATTAFATAIADDYYLGAIVDGTTFPDDAPVPIPEGEEGGGGGGGSTPHGIMLAFNDPTLEPNPTWTAIDQTPGIKVQRVHIQRGRSSEHDLTNVGTATIEGIDTDGVLDATNTGSPWFGQLNPRIQAKIERQHPISGTWFSRFRGFVDDIEYEIDISGKFARFTITLVDALDILSDAEVVPDAAGKNLTGADAPGDVYYDPESITKDRILAALADAALSAGVTEWPADLMTLYTGNVKLKGTVYSSRTSILQVIDDAANAEFPGVANRYIDRAGVFVFHGRGASFDPAGVSSANRGTWDYHDWKVGDVQAFNDDPATAVISPLKFNRSRDNLINAAIATPDKILDADVAGQFVSDSTSIAQYGASSTGFENLYTDGKSDGSTTDLEETKKFATYYVENYKQPQNRVGQITFRSRPPDDEKGQPIWDLMCGADIADTVTLKTTHPGGGGFDNVQFDVAGIEEEWTPLNKPGLAANSLWHDTTFTFDLLPRAFYTTDPF